MTLKIEISALYEILKNLPQDPEGFASTKTFLEQASIQLGCAPLSVRNFVHRHSSSFQWKHGRIKILIESGLPEQKLDFKEFEDWSVNRTAVLDECLEFLKVQTPSPYIENLLVLAGSARDEFKSYNDSSLAQLIFDLRREFNFVPQITLKEGETKNAE